MPDGLTEAGTKVAADLYYNNKSCYPYRMYMNWRPHDEGNILYNDCKFLNLLYSWNRDDFTYTGHVTVMTEDTKNNICRFMEDSKRTAIVVDCENADAYRFHAVLDYLGPELLESVEKILLFNDTHLHELVHNGCCERVCTNTDSLNLFHLRVSLFSGLHSFVVLHPARITAKLL